MMQFDENRPIYRQIIDYCFEQIIAGAWKPDERIPSVRELAVAMTVNTHTVLKALEYLQNAGVIFPRRGMGYFLESDARTRVESLRREEFYSDTLPSVVRQMQLLGISIEELTTEIKKLYPQS